jgi:hypothetical protein
VRRAAKLARQSWKFESLVGFLIVAVSRSAHTAILKLARFQAGPGSTPADADDLDRSGDPFERNAAPAGFDEGLS